MPVPSSVVGQRTEPINHTVDRRWLMAYAAGLGDHRAAFLDPTRAGGIEAHPLFPVCVEWPTVLAVRRLAPLVASVTADEARRGVHATHDLTIERPIRPGDELSTTATVIGVERRKPGAFLTMDLLSVDASGRPVCRTRQGTLYLGVDVDGPDVPAGTGGPGDVPGTVDAHAGGSGPDLPVATLEVPVDAGAAHVYTECARIWNPIHTDRTVALAAGLDGIILHGTATLAHGVTAAMDGLAGGDPTRIRRITGRFGAMVPLPSRLTALVFADGRFEVHDETGRAAVGQGRVEIHPTGEGSPAEASLPDA